MERYSKGDNGAFLELYDELVPRLYAFVLRKTGDRTRADDLVQQTMLQVHRARGRFIPGSRVTPWVYAIGNRLFLDQVRRKKVELLAFDEDGQEGASDRPGPDASAESRELESLVRAETERLSPSQREAFELVFYAQMSHAEAAETLGVTVASVKLRLQRAIQALKNSLGACDLPGIGR